MKALGSCAGMLLFAAAMFGGFSLLAYVAQLVAGGFDYRLPFWPTVGAMYLLWVVAGWFGGRGK